MSQFKITFLPLLLFLINFYASHTHPATYTPSRNMYMVQPSLNGGDDAPAIVAAFHKCGQGGSVVFMNHTNRINMNYMEHCLYAYLFYFRSLYGTEINKFNTSLEEHNTSFWLSHSLPIGYQNQSSAWFLGGSNYLVR